MHSCTLKCTSHDSHFWPKKWSKSGQKVVFLTSKRWFRWFEATLNISGFTASFHVKNGSFLSEKCVLLWSPWAFYSEVWKRCCSKAGPKGCHFGVKSDCFQAAELADHWEDLGILQGSVRGFSLLNRTPSHRGWGDLSWEIKLGFRNLPLLGIWKYSYIYYI